MSIGCAIIIFHIILCIVLIDIMFTQDFEYDARLHDRMVVVLAPIAVVKSFLADFPSAQDFLRQSANPFNDWANIYYDVDVRPVECNFLCGDTSTGDLYNLSGYLVRATMGLYLDGDNGKLYGSASAQNLEAFHLTPWILQRVFRLWIHNCRVRGDNFIFVDYCK